jgi:hypothetical protein
MEWPATVPPRRGCFHAFNQRHLKLRQDWLAERIAGPISYARRLTTIAHARYACFSVFVGADPIADAGVAWVARELRSRIGELPSWDQGPIAGARAPRREAERREHRRGQRNGDTVGGDRER